MKTIGAATSIVATGLLAYLAVWPVPIEPVAWNPPRAPAPEGVYAPNNHLATAQPGIDFPGVPSEVLLGPDGNLHFALVGGRIAMMAGNRGDNLRECICLPDSRNRRPEAKYKASEICFYDVVFQLLHQRSRSHKFQSLQ